MTSPFTVALADHLWQSTLFAAVVGCLALLLRRNSARLRCLLWLVAPAKFLIPFALLTAIGARLPWSVGILQGTEPVFSSFAARTAAHLGGRALTVCAAVWAIGTLVILAHGYVRWRAIRESLRASTPTDLAFVIPVRLSASRMAPGVVGILRPVLLLPRGIEARLTAAELRAVLAHERCHVAWQDNLAAAAHMLVQALLWFHPLIWWVGVRIIVERERACDQQVLADGHAPEGYAEGIVKVCEHYLETGLECVAGIGGANLNRRIADILENRPIERTTRVRKLMIALAACGTFAVPVALGVRTAPQALAAKATSGMYLGPPRTWELRNEVWLGFPDPLPQSRH